MSQAPTRHAITILRPPDEVYRFWRNWSHLAEVSRHLVSVEDLGDNRTRWTAESPKGPVTWEAETTHDDPGRRLIWSSLPGAEVSSDGAVVFKEAPGQRGTEVYVVMSYDAPGGVLASWWAKATGDEPEQAMAETLRRVKAILECGELPTVEGQSSGLRRGDPTTVEESRRVGLR